MRTLLGVSFPVETDNNAAKAEGLSSALERILTDLKPGAADFFMDDDGQRSGAIEFDLKDTSQILAIAEPPFLAFNGNVSLRPPPNAQDLGAAGPSIAEAAQQYWNVPRAFNIRDNRCCPVDRREHLGDL
jgi:hypothetical protein